MSRRILEICLAISTLAPAPAFAIAALRGDDNCEVHLLSVKPENIRPGMVLRINADYTSLVECGLEAPYHLVLRVDYYGKILSFTTRYLSESEQVALRRGQDLFPPNHFEGETFPWRILVSNGQLLMNRPRRDGQGEVLTRADLNMYQNKRGPGTCQILKQIW